MPQIDTLFSNFASHLNLLRNEGLTTEKGEYICPICLSKFDKTQIKELSLEDAPQASLGGSKIAITCKKCNNTCGHEIDSHLTNFIKYIEEKEFLPGSNRRVKIFDEEKIVNAILEVGNSCELKMIIPGKINNPTTLSNHISKMKEGEIIDIQNNPLKIDMKKVSVAILKNAYILLFAKFGYSFLLDKFYNQLRAQILEPMRYIIPDGLWTKQSTIPVSDGIYFSNNNKYKGFFVIYSLKRLTTHRFCVCIPTPQVYFEKIAYFFREYKIGTPLQIVSIGDKDYMNDINSIKEVKKWLLTWMIF